MWSLLKALKECPCMDFDIPLWHRPLLDISIPFNYERINIFFNWKVGQTFLSYIDVWVHNVCNKLQCFVYQKPLLGFLKTYLRLEVSKFKSKALVYTVLCSSGCADKVYCAGKHCTLFMFYTMSGHTGHCFRNTVGWSRVRVLVAAGSQEFAAFSDKVHWAGTVLCSSACTDKDCSDFENLHSELINLLKELRVRFKKISTLINYCVNSFWRVLWYFEGYAFKGYCVKDFTFTLRFYVLLHLCYISELFFIYISVYTRRESPNLASIIYILIQKYGYIKPVWETQNRTCCIV